MPTIDNKVVQMTFDNKQFEQGAKQSMKTLEELKKALELDKAVDSLQNLEKAANNFDVSGMAKSIDEISDRFTLMGRIGQKVFDEIAGTVVGTAKKVTDTIVSMPKLGWSKYEAQTKAVQTIQSSLPDKPLEEIKAVLGDLIEYTDLTSYDFATMATTLGKFTSIGVDLGVAEKAIEGIANEAASAGGEISQANTAMYNFAQAMAAGSMKVTDWVSINKTASLGTKEFKERVIETAIGLGKLKRVGENVGATSKGLAVDFQSFESTLRYGWFDRDVMLAVLNEYADRTQGVGQKAFEAASKAITFGQAMEAVKDAISTGWMNSFTYIFGDLEEATKLFSGINDALVELAEHFYLPRNEMLQMWHEGIDGMSGYKLAMEALVNIWDVFSNIIYKAQEAFAEIFGSVEDTAGAFINATASLRDFTVELRKYFGIFNKEDAEEAIDETIESVNEYTEALERGARGDSVRKMQEMLMWLGNDMIKLDKYGADGIFGPETERAVREFQKAFNLEENGVLDAATQQKLSEEFLPNAVKNIVSSFNKELEIGARGEDVKKMQQMLLDLGDDMIKLDKYGADGIYGKETRRAIMDFQRSAGLMMTGIFDKDTLIALAKALYPEPGESETIVEETVEEVDNLHRGLDGLKGIFRGVAATAKIFVNIVRIGAGVVGGLLKAIIPVVAGVFAVGGAIGDAVSAFASFLDGVTNVEGWMTGFNILLAPITAGLNVLSEFLFGVADGITTIVTLAKEATSFENIGEMLFSMDPETNSYAYAIYNLMTQIKNVADQARPYVQAFGAVMTVLLKHAYEWVGNKVNIVLEKLRTLLGDLWKRITEGKLVQKVLGGVLLVFRGLIGAVSTLVSWITSLGNAIWNGIKMVGSLIVNSKFLQNIFGTVGDTVAPLKEQFDRLRDAFKNFTMIKFKNFDHFWKRFTEALSKSDLTKWLVKPLNKLKSLLSKPAKLFNNITKAIEKITSMSKKGMGLDAILETLKTNPEQNKTAIGLINFLLRIRNLIDSVISFGKKMGEGLQRNFGGVWDRIKSFSSSVWDSIKEFFTPSEGESFTEHIRGKIDEIRGKISEKWNEVVVWAQGIIDGSPFLSTVAGKVSSIWDGVLDFFTPAEGESFESSVDAKVKEAMAPVEDAFNYVKDTFEGGTAKAEMDRLIESGMDEESAARKSGYYRTLPAIIETIKTSFINAKNDIAKWWVEFKQSPIVAPVISFVESVWGDITKFFEPTEKDENIVDYIFNRIVQAKTGIRNASEEVKKFVAEVKKNPVVKAVINFASSAWGNIAEFFFPGEDGKGLVEHIEEKVAGIKEGFTRIREDVSKWWEGVKNAPIIGSLVKAGESIWNGVVDFFVPSEGETFIQHIETEVGKVKSNLQNVVSGIVEFFTGKESKNRMDQAESLYGQLSDLVGDDDDIHEIARTNRDAKAEYYKTLPGIIDLFRQESNVFDSVVTVLENAWGRFTGLISEITTMVGNFFTMDVDENASPLDQFLQRLHAFDPVGKWFEEFGNKIENGFNDIKTGITGVTEHEGGIFGWLTEQVSNIIKSFNNSSLDGLIDQLWSILWKIGPVYLAVKGIQALGGGANIISNLASMLGWKFGLNKGTFINNLSNLFGSIGNSVLKTGLGVLSAAAGLLVLAEAIRQLNAIFYDIENSTGEEKWKKTQAMENVKTLLLEFFAAIGIINALSSRGTKMSLNTGFSIDGVLAIAGAVWILVQAIDSLLAIEQKYNIEAINELFGEGGFIIGLFAAIAGIDVAASIVDAKLGGALGGLTGSIAGPLAIAASVEIIVDAMGRMIKLVKENKVSDFEYAKSFIESIFAFFVADGIIDVLKNLTGEAKYNWLGELTSAGGILGFAYAVQMICQAFTDGVNGIKDIDSDHIEAFKSVIESLSVIGSIFIDAAGVIGGVAGAINPLAGSTADAGMAAAGFGFDAFGQGIATMAEGLSKAIESVKDVDVTQITAFSDAVEALSVIGGAGIGLAGVFPVQALAGSTAMAAAIGMIGGIGAQVVNKFSWAMRIVGERIGQFGADTEGIDITDLLTKAGNGLKDFASIIINDIGVDNADSVSSVLTSISGALALYYGNLAGIDFDPSTHIDAQTLRDAFTALADAVPDSLNNTFSSFEDSTPDGDEVTSFGIGIVSLGSALRDYAEKIGGLDESHVANANKVMETISNLEIKKEGGLFALLIGDSSLSTFADNIAQVGTGIGDFVKNIEEIHGNESIVDDALGILTRISSIEEGLAFASTLGKSSSTEIAALGVGIQQFFGSLAEITNPETYLEKTNNSYAAGTAVADTFAKVIAAIKTAVDEKKEFVASPIESLINSLYTTMDERTPQFYNIGANIDLGIAAGLFDYQGTSIVAAIAVAKACYDAACHFLGVNSPSREFAWIGQQLDAGLAKGLYDYASNSTDASSYVSSSILDTAKEGLSGFETAIFDQISDTPVISPILDLSNVSSNASRIGGILGSHTLGVSMNPMASKINVGSVASVRNGNTSNSDLAAAVDALNLRMDQLGNAIANMKVVTDTGAVIGAISTGVDERLGENQYYSSRGL